ncbi:MAG TPA: hypothetical protein VIX14_09755 [Terriglobales bacterium]
MRNKSFSCGARALVVVFAVGISAFAQNRGAVQFRGTINDFTPEHSVIPSGASGPWELHGNWRLQLKGDSGLANFSATLTMEDSDYWLMITPNPPANPDAPATRSPHTHHIAMKDAQVTWDPSAVSSGCPTANYKPPTTSGFMVTGMASVTANGGFAPFAPGGQLSPLTVCVTGGTLVEFSNITLVLGAPASEHFGSQPINGAVRIRK